MDLININELTSYNPFLQTYLLHIDFEKTAAEINEKHKKIREQQPNGPICTMRSEAKRLRSLLPLNPKSTWSPKELASAGFFNTGVKDSCQCFCCGLVFCTQSLSVTPIEKHKKFNPDCAFIQGIDVGNISKYDIRPQSIEISPSDHRMQDEQARLQTFSCWPPYTLMEPDVLAQAGLFFTGTRDHVQCFSCGGCLGNWEENDDPWKEHAKWFPECEFLQGKKSTDEIQQYSDNYNGFKGITGSSFKKIWNTEIGPALSPEISKGLDSLKEHLIEKYHDRSFQRVPPFGDTISVDLDSQFADICVMLKDRKNQAVRQLILPDILSELNDITMIEGEANSGKTALLRKIAILWASGSCPILSRFSLVFYISLASTESHQTLSDIICQQLIGPSTSLTEESLGEITGKLKDKVLFLLDDYGVQDSTPKPVEELILKNPWNRLNLAVTVSTDKGRKLRQYARTIMSIQKFPLYSSIYLAKKLLSHDIERVRAFFAKLETSENLAAIFEIPLIILLQCSFWIRYPSDNTVGDIKMFKEYIKYNISKFSNETLVGNSMVSLCGELSLNGLFQSQFQFTENDLRAASVDGDRAIKYGLLSKFTAQRLQSTYRFYSTSFQEFLAGKRLCELLESENPEDLEKGLHYLYQVNTFLKIIGRYRYFLNYATRISTKATLNIFSYLFSLYDKPEALDCHLDSTEHLQRHPDLEIEEMIFIMIVRKIIKTDISSICMNLLMASAIEAAVENKCLLDCAPIILQFMAGKTMSFSVSPFSKGSNLSILYFIEEYPKCITLLSSVKFEFALNKMEMENEALDFPGYLKAHESYGIPTVDEDYSSAISVI
ncbi:baculoviral IAP repeat-containing protein 1-like [Engystomops pustulosus]|uniref:baculoviral IAP repeat-containing protein 1-like n=1 Tax=Engystomops pustulosus TaxID=76066 RepID=UPI003AFA0D70